MNFIVRIIITLLTVVAIPIYVLFSIFKSSKVFFLVPIFIFLPFLLLPFRKLYLSYYEVFLGHYLFYFAYIFFSVIGIFILGLLLRPFSINIYKNIGEYKVIGSSLFLVFLLVLGVLGIRNFNKIAIREHNVEISKSSTVKNLKIGFISDLHLNAVFDTKKLDNMLKEFEKERVQLVLIGGDLLDNTHTSVKDNLGEVISKYKFPHGIHMALGNHEYYGGIEENIEYIKNNKINILRDEYLNLDGIYIIGRDDKHNKDRKNIASFGIEKDAVKILVDHNPISIPESIQEGIDLHLSGHTHNGQIAPVNLLVDYINENGYGYKKFGETHTLVSSGLGTWMIPYRIGSKSEALIINIKTN